MPTVIAFSGSARKDSFNRKLIALATERAIAAGATVDLVDLRALAMPIYDGDLEDESGRPAGAETLREKILAADGILIATPEYNHSVPALLKNAIDWVSRPPGKLAYRGKVAAIMGASGGPSGTLRVQPQLRQTLSALGCYVMPGAVSVSFADKAFDASGKFVESKLSEQLTTFIGDFVALCAKLKA